MAQSVSLRPITAEAWVQSKADPLGFVVDKEALR